MVDCIKKYVVRMGVIALVLIMPGVSFAACTTASASSCSFGTDFAVNTNCTFNSVYPVVSQLLGDNILSGAITAIVSVTAGGLVITGANTIIAGGSAVMTWGNDALIDSGLGAIGQQVGDAINDACGCACTFSCTIDLNIDWNPF